MTQSIPDLTPIFAAYETLVAEADAVFSRVSQLHPDCVTCKSGCSDCCNAMFDLSLVEALYVNHKFQETYGYGAVRSTLLEAAADVDRKLTRMKREYFRQLRDAKASEEAIAEVLQEAAKVRVRCPLLGQDDNCALYAFRPITCRLYGIPQVIGGKAHVCGKSSFAPGVGYPTVYIDKIQESLDKLSLQIQEAVASRFKELHTVYVPVSMALLTTYDAAYLGIGQAPAEKPSL
ncbi:MAG: YkgJ family cysteine cluster protein [Bilophila sp.]